MNVTSTQYADLLEVFSHEGGREQVDELLAFLATQIDPLTATTQSIQTSVAALQQPLLWNLVSRSLDTDFVISTTRNSYVVYSVELTVAVSFGGITAQEADCTLMVNGNQVEFGRNLINSTLSIGTATTHTLYETLACIVPAGGTVRLDTTGTTGTVTLLSPSSEVLL